MLCVIAACFHLYTGFFSPLTGVMQRSISLALISTVCFLTVPASKKEKIRKVTDWTDLLLVVGICVAMAYIVFNYEHIVKRIGIITDLEIFLGILTIVLVLESVRRTTGIVLPIIAIVFLLYARFGYLMPEVIANRGYTWSRIASQMYMTTEGIFGSPLAVCANYIVLFVLFGAFLNLTGAGEFFMNLAFSATAWARGGPAKSAVVASGLFGSISGSACANVTTTGTFTIPLMIKTGYSRKDAGAVETVASTGGLIMPPVMGSAAFIMSEMIGVPYVQILKAAIIPALLYYVSLFLSLDFIAQKNHLKGIPRSELKSVKETLKGGFEFFIPLVLLVVLMCRGFSPAKSATYSIICMVAVSFFRKEHRMTWKTFVAALEEGITGSVTICATCATAGIIVGVVTMTGMGLTLSTAIIQLSGGILILALALTMICSLILGMGMPSSAAYIVLAVLAAPALIKLGVGKLTAHFFIFYFGVLSNITPPVALAAFAAAPLAKESAMKIGWNAVRLGCVAFIVPYFFVFGPSLLMQGTALEVIQCLLTAFVGVWALSIVVAGFFKRNLNAIERILFAIGAVLMIESHLVTDLIGLFFIGSMVLYCIKTRNKHASKATPVNS